MAKGHGSQCGFCTPGIVMSFYSLLKLNPTPSLVDIEESFDGNLCRCTGYRPIIDVARSFASEEKCKEKSSCCSSKSSLVDFAQFKAYDPNADLPFPSQLMQKSLEKPLVLKLEQEGVTWIEPTNLEELLEAKHMLNWAKLIGGNTEIGVEMKFKSMDHKTFINVSNLKELQTMRLVRDEESGGKRYLKIGVNITLTDLIDAFKGLKEARNPDISN